MRIKILGSHGSDLFYSQNGKSHRCQCVGFLVNEHLLVDAGTVASALDFEAQTRIDHVILSHLHLDHIKGVPPLVDNRVGTNGTSICISSVAQVLDGLKTHIFNDIVFPNFFSLQNGHHPYLQESTLKEGTETLLGDIRVTPIHVNHTVTTVGFLIQDDQSAWIYSGDTYQTEELWALAARTPNLKGALIETSFPNEFEALAKESKHLTPTLLAKEYQKIGKPELPLYVFHLKPQFREQIASQLHDLALPSLCILQEGQEIEL
ncbi:MAG: 3',5'-cyclic-nucleotide phosphodiesterase [Nitrospirota bacterium]|nr:3',5'-cyclic-nucleotide phosphodiesterase [Nitrospirota bacterium]